MPFDKNWPGRFNSIEATRALPSKELFDGLREIHSRGESLREYDVSSATGPLSRLIALMNAMKAAFVDRSEAVELLVASTMAGVPVVLFGPPGTSKSLMVRRMAELCGLETQGGAGAKPYFEYLLTQHTMPEEIFGPPLIRKLMDGLFQRNVERMLPRAEFAFLDEVFRGGSHILNTLLAIINERVFHDGSEVIAVPLLNVVGAANKPPPATDDFAAIYDRFPIRVWVNSVLEDADPVRTKAEDLLKKSARFDGRQLSSVASLNDFWILRARLVAEPWEKWETEGRKAFLGAVANMRRSCTISDRSLLPLLRVARAWAMLSGDARGENPASFESIFAYAAPDEAAHRNAIGRVRGKDSGDVRGRA